MDISQNIYTQFKLPIQCIDHTTLSDTILQDLELVGESNIMGTLINSESIYGQVLQNSWSSHYTTNVTFLKEFQKLMKRYNPVMLEKYNYLQTWGDFKQQTAFKEKYAFLEWKHLDIFNRSSKCMQIMSCYNLASPAINLCIPFFFLLFPFILMKCVHKIPITFSAYKKLMFQQLKHNVFGKCIQEFSSQGNWDKKMYTLLGVCFYCFSMYQNTLACVRFYNNLYSIQTFLYLTKQHASYVVNKMDECLPFIKKYRTMKPFYGMLVQNRNELCGIIDMLHYVKHDKFAWKRFLKVGSLMSDVYRLFYDTSVHDTMCYSFGFLGFVDNMNSIHNRIKTKKIHKCLFRNKTVIKEQYYLPLLDDPNVVTNTVDITTKNLIITGPNASGKTTLLKTTFINLILSQQIGFGCYSRCSINPYDCFYSYLNIPDTSGRDSLFQAEARRCLDILRVIQRDSDKRHFCIFDELYSGTNPHEAISSARCYLEYLTQHNISFMLTTHYYQLCDMEQTNDSIQNKHMLCIQNEDDSLVYTYRLKNGKSTVHGGFNVLRDLNYPDEILQQLDR